MRLNFQGLGPVKLGPLGSECVLSSASNKLFNTWPTTHGEEAGRYDSDIELSAAIIIKNEMKAISKPLSSKNSSPSLTEVSLLWVGSLGLLGKLP